MAPGSGVPSGRPIQTAATWCASNPNAQASRPPQLVPVFQATPGRSVSGNGCVSTRRDRRRRARIEERFFGLPVLLAQHQGRRAAVGGERGVQARGLPQRDAGAAQRQRQRRVGAGGQPQLRARRPSGVAANRIGPTRSSSATAGRFSERRNASAAVTSPAKPRSKSSGA